MPEAAGADSRLRAGVRLVLTPLFECAEAAAFYAVAAADAFAVVDLDCVHLARPCAGVAVRAF